MKVAVVGLGNWGMKVCDSIASGEVLDVVLGMDIVPAAAERVAAKHGFAISDNYAAVLADESVEGVILVTPPSGHEEQLLAAAAAGKHVLCEKPFSLSVAGAERMVEACASRGLTLGIDHERRFEPAWEELQRVVRAGELGDIVHVEANHSHGWMVDLPADHWRRRTGEGPSAGLTGMGVHFLDLFTSLFGRPESVSAWTSSMVGGFANGDIFSTHLRWPDGMMGTVTNVCVTPFHVRVAVFGREGWLEIREEDMGSGSRGSVLTVARPEGRTSTTYEPIDSVKRCVEAWAKAATEGGHNRYTGEQLIDTVATVVGIDESITAGGPVVLPR